LFERIAENARRYHAYPFNRNADKQSFAIRNRIVAGMTLGAVIVEADSTAVRLSRRNLPPNTGDRFLPCRDGLIRREQGLSRPHQERREAMRRRGRYFKRVRIFISASNRPPRPAKPAYAALELSENEQRFMTR